jgi:membrane protease YdiL (CAAX protease family)
VRTIFQKDAFKILLYLAAVLTMGAVLAPALYNVGKAVVGFRLVQPDSGGLGAYLHKVLSTSDFKRYFNRAIMVSALICLVPLLKSLKIKRADLGLEKNSRWASHFGVGFVTAAAFLLVMGGAYLSLKIFKTNVTLEAGDLFTFIISALAVGVLEEFFFRGALMGIVMRGFKPMAALLFVSVIFSLVHFLKPPVGMELTDKDVNWGTGFWLIGQIFAQFGNPIFIAAEFTTLFAVGWILGVARLKTQSLWLSVGLHAGWVFSLKIYTELSDIPRALRNGDSLPWVGTDLKVGVVPLVVVALTGVVVFFWLKRWGGTAATTEEA